MSIEHLDNLHEELSKTYYYGINVTESDDIGSKGTAGIDNKADRTLPGEDLPQMGKAPVLHGNLQY